MNFRILASFLYVALETFECYSSFLAFLKCYKKIII